MKPRDQSVVCVKFKVFRSYDLLLILRRTELFIPKTHYGDLSIPCAVQRNGLTVKRGSAM
jgi:hypothetical protein